MTITRIFLLGVALGVAFADQSESTSSNEEQLDAIAQGKGRLETPEVVLQLKYDHGGLNKIYLAQFRKGKGIWIPSVPARTTLCTDLCHAGLGGEACGPTCDALMPVGLKSALINATSAELPDVVYGEPRMDVCPALCENQLGSPLCNCASTQEHNDAEVDWAAICSSFCVSDYYVLRGCPSCDKTPLPPIHLTQSFSRTLSTAEGWAAWCNAQCRQGHGGAACNCDRAPL